MKMNHRVVSLQTCFSRKGALCEFWQWEPRGRRSTLVLFLGIVAPAFLPLPFPCPFGIPGFAIVESCGTPCQVYLLTLRSSNGHHAKKGSTTSLLPKTSSYGACMSLSSSPLLMHIRLKMPHRLRVTTDNSMNCCPRLADVSPIIR